MRAVKSKNTKPELTLRKFLRAERIKYRTYASMPGRPDIVLPERKIALRVMGCFWHGHSCPRGDRMPKTNVAYWSAKIARNVVRDRQNKRDLKRLGWRVLDVWECRLREPNWSTRLKHRLRLPDDGR